MSAGEFMRRSIVITILALGCVEYDITKPAKDADPADPGDTVVSGANQSRVRQR